MHGSGVSPGGMRVPHDPPTGVTPLPLYPNLMCYAARLMGGQTGRTEGRTVSGTRAGRRGQGVPIGEAAQQLGLNVDAVRKRIKRGTLPAYKEDERWYVALDGVLPGVQPAASYPAGSPVQDAVQDDQPPIEAAYRVTPAAIEQAVSRTSAQYMGDLRTMLAEVGKVYEGQLAAKDAALAAKDQALAADALTIAELRRRAEMAEQADSEPSALEQGQARLLAERGTALHAKEEVLTMQRRTIATLREEVMQLKIEREQQAASAALSALETLPEAQQAAPVVWGRVRRWWGGGA